MTVQYREFAVPVDPEFARELKAQLDAQRVQKHEPSKPADDQAIHLTRTTEVPLVLTPAKQPDHRWRLVGLLAAAGIAAFATGTVLVIATSDDDADPRPTATLPPESTAPTTVAPPSASEAQEAIDITQRFVEGRDAWDGAAVRALVTDDVVIDDFAVSNPDDYLALAEIEQATGWRFMQPECAATVLGPPVEVTCTYIMQNAWSEAIGAGPFFGSSFEFVIVDGQIQQVTHNFDSSQFSSQVYDIFRNWLNVIHPDDVDAMFDFDNGNLHLTPEAIALFELHTTEFEAVQPGIRFVEGRDAWDGAAVRALVTDDAAIDDFAVSNPDDYLALAEIEQATGWRFMQPECTATVLGPPVEVTCTYIMQNAWSEAIGAGPFFGSSFEFVIVDGQIQQVTHNFDSSQFSSQVYDVFRDWLNATYPADVDAMFDFDNGNLHLTAEAIALFEQHTREFVSSRNNSGSD